VAAPPAPPARHEKWIRARQKSSGEYMSEETRCIADKIVSIQLTYNRINLFVLKLLYYVVELSRHFL
jgi:hypothetical protein